MITYHSGLSKEKRLSVLLSIIETANDYPGSIGNKKVKKLITTILDHYPDPIYKKSGITVIEHKGKVYTFKI